MYEQRAAYRSKLRSTGQQVEHMQVGGRAQSGRSIPNTTQSCSHFSRYRKQCVLPAVAGTVCQVLNTVAPHTLELVYLQRTVTAI